MTLRKKLAVSTIAASVAMSAFAGIPLSNKGLAEKLGVSDVAYASTTTANSVLIDRAKAIYNALDKTGGLDEVEALRNAINSLTDAQKEQIVKPIVDKFIPASDANAAAKKADLKDLILDAVSLSYSPSAAGVEALRVEHGAFVQTFATAAGVANLTVDDFANYFFDIQDEVMKQLKSKDLSALLALLSESNGVNDLLEDVIAALPENEYAVEKVFLYYKVTTEDVINVATAVKSAVNDNNKFNQAALALYTAYQSLNTPTTGGGGGGGAVVTTPVIELPKAVNDYVGKLDAVKDAIAKATGEEKTKLIEAAVKEAQALVNTLSTISASSSIATINGRAVLQLDEKQMVSAIAGIAAIAEGLQGAVPGAKLSELKLTIDLGNVTQNDTVIDLSNAIMQQAVKAKITAVTLKISDLTVELPVGGQFSNAINFTISKSDAKAEVIGNSLKAASKVYDFNLSIGGVATTKFDQPILISIPLGDTTGLDTELLSVAKIVNGKLIFQGGRIKKGHIVEPRDTFSSYVVVENKVSFSDVASVEAWAGREIQVVAAKGAIEGKAAGKFAPQDKVTRAEFAKMLVRALDLDNGSATESFDDVKASDWHAPYVAAAANLKIINGRSASKFDPNATITRAEMATMIARALKVSQGASDVADVNTALKGFADAGKISASLKAGVAFAASNGIVKGNAGKFLPNNNATRAEAAVIIYRAINFGE
ncbi:S-layer homology domain-containing protein [Paenibacillus prosopidis]|uniref:S-layer family protein n=1 Tax=Paenibacillus prosopidis TaxID=630520 RepID=A0A368W4V7_9BACL|nr:S-layer homology domain-containing protein [Paenibacillus prosopidis]RCW47896.1 S-layer family protein [Paenibacillus prosopidis]